MQLGNDWTRRAFLKNLSLGIPTVKLLLDEGGIPAWAEEDWPKGIDPAKFTPIDLNSHFTTAPADWKGLAAGKTGVVSPQDGLMHTPSGKQSFRGVPFSLGPEGGQQKCWVGVSDSKAPWLAKSFEIHVNQKASFICLAQFCNWNSDEVSRVEDIQGHVGQKLAEFTLIFEDGNQEVLPIRRRFEVNAPSVEWGGLSFLSLTQTAQGPRSLTESLGSGIEWGRLQESIRDNSYSPPLVWISALPNPHPDRTIKAIRVNATSQDLLMICGISLFHGKENPLRYERLATYQITLPEPLGDSLDRWKVDIDLGVIARTWFPEHFEPASWLTAPDAGLGGPAEQNPNNRLLCVELTASSEATLWLRDTKSGKAYAFDIGNAETGKEMLPRDPVSPGPKLEVLGHEKVWLHGQVTDSTTGLPTPVRLAFRSPLGRYIPPYGHRTEINAGFFQDYGADVKVKDSSFAYVDGTFQVELPVGDVYLEMTKGFEYAPVRRKLQIQPGQREIKLEIERFADLRSDGWVCADTHTHFLSPSTALLEASAEGLNLVNLLAAQWGDLFTNVGDITNEPLLSRDKQTMVWVGSENRQHILGHIALLGPQAPILPMSAGGVDESYLGDPLWNSMAQWADACRDHGGLAVGAHFPYPTGEIAADVALGKLDAVELWPDAPRIPQANHFNFLRYLDWYRYLNCGYRLPAVGGTDKMGAYMPVGTNRAYAYLGKEEFNFANWARAVRGGNTFVTSGPLLNLSVDGHAPGEDIAFPSGGGTVEVNANARSFVPFNRLEVVLNGHVVASREAASGTRELKLTERIRVPGPGWMAARCSSELGPVTTWEFMVQAHTSPVYLVVPGQELFSPQTASYMLTLIDGAQAYVENLAIRPDAQKFAQVRSVFEDARSRLHRRLHAHGIPH